MLDNDNHARPLVLWRGELQAPAGRLLGKSRPGGVEELSVAHDELPDVVEVGQGVALLHEHLLGVAHPDGVLGVPGGQPPY